MTSVTSRVCICKDEDGVTVVERRESDCYSRDAEEGNICTATEWPLYRIWALEQDGADIAQIWLVDWLANGLRERCVYSLRCGEIKRLYGFCYEGGTAAQESKCMTQWQLH